MSWIKDISITVLFITAIVIFAKDPSENIYFNLWFAVAILASYGSFGFEYWLHYVLSKRMTKQYPRFDLFLAAMLPNSATKMDIVPKDVLILKNDLILFRRSCFVFHAIAILLIILSTILLFQYS